MRFFGQKAGIEQQTEGEEPGGGGEKCEGQKSIGRQRQADQRC